jgi:hypothetical protein
MDLKLVAFSRNIIFPGLLFEVGITAHREKKPLIMSDFEQRRFTYEPVNPIIQKFNVFTQILIPGSWT